MGKQPHSLLLPQGGLLQLCRCPVSRILRLRHLLLQGALLLGQVSVIIIIAASIHDGSLRLLFCKDKQRNRLSKGTQ
jgi:hypothetical protein